MKCCKILHVLLLLNSIVQGHNNRKTNTRKRRIKNGSKVAEKIDLVFIIDESEGMSEKDLQTAVKTTFKLLKHFSISPGTTRVGLYTVGENFKKHFQFRDHVNRECVMKNIRKLVLKTSQRNENFTENLRTGIDEIKEKHTDIEGQRRIYLYITNKAEDIKLIESELGTKLDRASEVIVLLLKKKHHKSNDMLKKNLFIDRRLRSGGKIQVVNLPTETEHILNKMNVKNKQYGICEHKKDGSPVMDECNRHCTCVNQKLTNCYRLRKEFTSMTSEERRRYLKAYKTLTTKSPYKQTYEPFIFMHYKYFCMGIHDYRLLLPWHRWYLSMMEDLLRQIDCGVTIPYWDWSYVSHDPWNRTNLWRSSNDGLGPNGDQSKGYCVQEGLFRESQWKTPYWEDPLNIIMKSGQKLGGKLEEQREH
uniref:VWFA domain-containing protein n=2 Tax=Clytia hemisphaerica TaxID=252671 RepID=A0A7M5V391_9CNID